MPFKFTHFNIGDTSKPDVQKPTSGFTFSNLDRAVSSRITQKTMEEKADRLERSQEQSRILTGEAQKLSSPLGVLKETFRPSNLLGAAKQLPRITGGIFGGIKEAIKEPIKTGAEVLPAFTQGAKWGVIGRTPEQEKKDIETRKRVLRGGVKDLGKLASGVAKTSLQIGLYLNKLAPEEEKEKARKRIRESKILNYKPEYADKYEKFGAGATEFGTWLIPLTRLKMFSSLEKAITELPRVAKFLNATPTIVKSGSKFFYEVGKDVADVAILNKLRGKNWEESKKELVGVGIGSAVLRGGLKLFTAVSAPAKKGIGDVVVPQKGGQVSKEFMRELKTSFEEQVKGQFTDPEMRKMVFNPDGSIKAIWAKGVINDAAHKMDIGVKGAGKIFRQSVDVNNVPSREYLFQKSLDALKQAGAKNVPLATAIERVAVKAEERLAKFSIPEYIKNKPNITVEEVKTLGKNIDNKPVKSRLEWNFKEDTGKLIITPETTADDLAHEVGHILRRENPNILQETKSEVIKLTGGKKNLSEDFADAVKDVIAGKKISSKLAAMVEEQGIKIEKAKPIKPILKKLEEFEGKRVMDVPIEEIGGVYPKQLREKLGDTRIKEFSKIPASRFPPIELERTDSGIRIVDGNARLLAARERGEKTIKAIFKKPAEKGEKKFAIDKKEAVKKPVIIDPDRLKAEAGDFDPAHHEKYSQKAKEQYTRALKEIENPEVKFTAGGSGSGKSELMLPKMAEDFDGIIVDGTGSNYTNIAKKIKQAEEAGKRVKIHAILPDIERAWEFTVKRGQKTGRKVPLKEFIKMHIGFVDTLKRLTEEGIPVVLKDTRGTITGKQAIRIPFIGDKKVILDKLSKVRYNESRLERQLKDVKITIQKVEIADGRRGVEKIRRGIEPKRGQRLRTSKTQPQMDERVRTDKGLKLAKKTRSIELPSKGGFILTKKKKMVEKAPTAVKNAAKKTYQKEVAKGTPKKEAARKAVAKVERYEQKVEAVAKKEPLIRHLSEERKYGPTPRKKVKTEGINWKTINTEKDTTAIIDNIFQGSKQFKEVRPSRTNKDIIEGARMVNIDVNDAKELDRLIKNFPNANVAHKLKQAMVDSAADLKEFINTVGDFALATPEQLKILKAKFVRTQGIARTFSGIRTESSSLLRSMGIEVVEGENQILEELGRGLQRISKESGEDFSIETMTKFLNKQQKLVEATRGDKALAIWYNSILSGWKTWTRNIEDTSFSLFSETFAKAANPTTLLEVPGFVAGVIKNLRYSIPEAIQVLRGKRVVQKYTTRGTVFGQTFKNKHVNTFFELSGRVLDAQDTVFSGTISKAEKGIEKTMRKAGINDAGLIDEVNKAVLAQFAERVTYRNKPLGVIGRISEKVGSLTTVVKPLKIILPFTKVVANVLDRKIDLIPLLNISRTFGKKYITEEARIILKKTNIPMSRWDELIPVISKRLKQQQLGRLYFGTLLTTGAFALARNGKLTGGGPANKNEKNQLRETGWRPWSIKIGNKYIPYLYFGPMSGILAIAGSINDGFKYNKKEEKLWEKTADGIIGFTRATLDQSFLSGVSDLFEVLSGNLNPSRYFRNLVTGIIPYPAVLQQTQSAIDGKSYDIQTWEEAIKYKFGRYKTLTPRLNALGEEIRADLIYGLTPTKEKNNLQKQFTERGLRVNIPATTTKIEDATMTREQLWEYTKIRGELIRKNSQEIFEAVDEQESQENKEKEFNSWINEISGEAKEQIKEKYDIENKEVISRKKKVKRIINE